MYVLVWFTRSNYLDKHTEHQSENNTISFIRGIPRGGAAGTGCVVPTGQRSEPLDVADHAQCSVGREAVPTVTPQQEVTRE